MDFVDRSRVIIANRLATRSAPSPLPQPPAVDLLPAATGLEPGLSLSSISSKLFPPLAERFRQLEAGMLRLREWLHPIVDSWHQFRVPQPRREHKPQLATFDLLVAVDQLNQFIAIHIRYLQRQAKRR